MIFVNSLNRTIQKLPQFRCCSNKPDFFITYSVSDSEKEYLVCSDCIKLPCFSKFVINKIPINDLGNPE